MTRLRSVFVAACVVGGLAGCQTAVRPDLSASEPVPLADPGDPATPVPLAEEGAVATLEGSAAALAANPKATGRGRQVFARITGGLGPNVCAAGSETWRKRYAGNPRVFAKHLEQILPILDFVSVEVERSGLPAEFVFIPLVESWYRPEAIGVGGPAGMWQMIGTTARNHGIHIQPGYDGRLSPVESTRAALSYLKTLQGMFGDWQAIVMAYNAGEGRMMRAFRQSANRDVSAANRKPHGLSNITYDYVSKLQALSCLVAEPGRSGLSLPNDAHFIPLAAVLVGERVSTLDAFAASSGNDPATLRRLNPGYRNGRIIDGVPRLVLTPFGGAIPVATPDTTPRGVPSVNTHEVRPGESIWSIAKLYRVSVEQLRRVNGLDRVPLRPGQKLKLFP